MNYIHVESLTKVYQMGAVSIPALNGVSFSISPGEFTAITGKSGSGKSTLLHLLSGIDVPSSGTVKIGPVFLESMNQRELSLWRGRSVGIVFQFFQLIPTLTISENIQLAMDFGGKIPRSERRKRTESLLYRVEIPDQAEKYPHTLSGGQQQRAAIARALANDPDLIVADEPTGNLDSTTAGRILTLFRGLINDGKSVVMVTHDREIANQADRVISLKDGEIELDSALQLKEGVV